MGAFAGRRLERLLDAALVFRLAVISILVSLVPLPWPPLRRLVLCLLRYSLCLWSLSGDGLPTSEEGDPCLEEDPSLEEDSAPDDSDVYSDEVDSCARVFVSGRALSSSSGLL